MTPNKVGYQKYGFPEEANLIKLYRAFFSVKWIQEWITWEVFPKMNTLEKQGVFTELGESSQNMIDFDLLMTQILDFKT